MRLLHFATHLVEPRGLAEGERGLLRRAEVERPFEAEDLAEVRVLRPPHIVERRGPEPPARRPLASRSGPSSGGWGTHANEVGSENEGGLTLRSFSG